MPTALDNLAHRFSQARKVSITFNWLSDFLYPASCMGCGIFTSKSEALCPNCWSDIQFIEKPYCEVTGKPFAYDLGDGIIAADAIANPPPFQLARAALLYKGTARAFVHRLKYKDRADISNLMANWMVRAGKDCLHNADCIVPVPLHLWRLMGRKYNQSAELARKIAEKTDLTYLPATLYRKKSTKPQVGLAANQRNENVRGAFHVPLEKRSTILGKKVILIDDVFTTGATVSAATKTLLKAGAAEVRVLTFARVEPED